MKVGYTEFSFGYAFTENLIRSSATAPIGAPVFPNLIQEGQWGFDIRIDMPAQPFFFQFKLPDVMRRNGAFEIAKHKCPGLNVPFFRIAIMRRDLSPQHALLMNLEGSFPDCVFYAAPCLRTVAEFDTAYNTGSVAKRSVFLSPSDIGKLPDNRPHSVAYGENLSIAYFLSEPQPIRVRSYGELYEEIRTHLIEK